MKKTVLAIFAHPDDAELMCAGTLSLLKQAGWIVHIATLTPGDKGTASLTREEISSVRKSEAANSAELLGGYYHCLEFEDIYIQYCRDSIDRVTSLIRKIMPLMVLTASPSDYMVDHELTSLIVQTACFSCGIKNLDIQEEPFETVPFLYYSDAMEGKDKFGSPVNPTIFVDISNQIGIKEQMLACHASQRNWLLIHHKMDEYIQSMKEFAGQRGKEIGTLYAEGFRQHLGHGYPQSNILKEILGSLVITT